MEIFMAVLAAIQLFGMIGSQDKEMRKDFTWAFMVTVVGIVVMQLFG